MVRKTISATITVLVAATLIWAANDPWKSKPYQQWDDKDVRKIFNDSPWAKVVQLAGSSGAGSPSSSPGAVPSAPSGNSMPQNRGMGGGSSGSQYPQPSVDQSSQPSTSTPYVVRWVSSRTIREAAVRSAELKGQIKPEDAEKDLAQPIEHYQVLVASPDMKAFQAVDEATLKNSTILELKKTKEKLTPTTVKIERSSDGSSIESIVFSFPKKSTSGEPTITPNEKSADFATSVAGTKINVSFDLSKMEDSQGRDL